jgi:hypothetical protein
MKALMMMSVGLAAGLTAGCVALVPGVSSLVATPAVAPVQTASLPAWTPSLGATRVSGVVTAAPATVRVGYVSWVEQMNDGTVKGLLTFDLVNQKTATFDRVATPVGQNFSLELTPRASVAEGSYVVLAWDDVDKDGVYEGDQGEKRATEVYRVRGHVANRSLWTTEKFVITDKKQTIEYADQNGGLSFTFQ